MRKIILPIVIFAFALSAFAQPGDRRLQGDLRNLDRRFETLRSLGTTTVNSNNENRVRRAVEAAEKQLETFKSKHPSYDPSAYEKELSEFKAAQENALVSKEAAVGDIDTFAATVEEILDFRPESTKFLSAKNGLPEESQSALAEFKSKMRTTLTPDFLALGGQTENRKIRNIASKTDRSAEYEARRISEADISRVKAIEEPKVLLLKYFDVAFTLEKLGILKQIFPGSEAVASAHESVSDYSVQLGSFEAVSILAKKNYAERIARVRMSPDVQRNPALKAEFTRVFRNGFMAPETLIGGSILKAHLVSSGWGIERNELTGIILNRSQTAQFAVKAGDGRCYLYTFRMKQNYNGSTYGGGIPAGNSESEMVCENVPK